MNETEYKDILYEETGGVASITFNRPQVLNAFRMGTYEEVTEAINRAGWNKAIGVIVLTGAGRAFGVGGDSGDKKSERAGRGIVGVPVEALHASIRDAPKPVIAKRSFNADTENIRGIANLGLQAVSLYYHTDEAKEGGNAFREKRKPRFRDHQK